MTRQPLVAKAIGVSKIRYPKGCEGLTPSPGTILSLILTFIFTVILATKGANMAMTKDEYKELEGLIQMTDKFENIDVKSILRRTELESKASEDELIEICEKNGINFFDIYP